MTQVLDRRYVRRRGDTVPGSLALTGVLTEGVQAINAANGGSTQLSNNVHQVILTNGSVIATHTLTLPATPVDGQYLGLAGGAGGVTTLTLSPSGGETINGTITTLLASTFASWQYRASDTTWWRVG